MTNTNSNDTQNNSTDDTILLAEEIGRLREALKEARNDANTWKDDAKRLKRKFQIANFWAWMVEVALIGAICGLVLYPAYKGITRSNTPTHCYAQTTKHTNVCGSCNRTVLMGNVEWGTDITLGSYESLEMANTAAKVMQCPLRATGN